MDIFKYAEETLNWSADYYDMHTGYIYGVVEGETLYNKQSIPVYQNGQLIGYVNQKDDK